MSVPGATLRRTALDSMVKRAKEARIEIWDRYFVPGDGAGNDRLFDQLDSQRLAVESLEEAGARAVKLMELAAEQLSVLNQAHDPVVAHLVKALAEAVGELA